jgi:hypothetical protein
MIGGSSLGFHLGDHERFAIHQYHTSTRGTKSKMIKVKASENEGGRERETYPWNYNRMMRPYTFIECLI